MHISDTDLINLHIINSLFTVKKNIKTSTIPKVIITYFKHWDYFFESILSVLFFSHSSLLMQCTGTPCLFKFILKKIKKIKINVGFEYKVFNSTNTKSICKNKVYR